MTEGIGAPPEVLAPAGIGRFTRHWPASCGVGLGMSARLLLTLALLAALPARGARAQPRDDSCEAVRLVDGAAPAFVDAGTPRRPPLAPPSWRGGELPEDPVADLLLRDPDPQPPRRIPFATLLASAYLGEALGLAVGALGGLLGAAIAGCDNDEGWLGGYTCFAGHGYAASLGALIGAPVGTAAGLLVATESMDLPSRGQATMFGGVAAGLAPGLIGPLTYMFTTELSLMFLLSFAAPVGLSPLLATLLYVGEARHASGFTMGPYARGVAAGAELGVRGRF